MHELDMNTRDLHGIDSLDVLATAMPQGLYTQICLCFSTDDAASDSAIINTLTDGLERLSASFPWVASKVVNEGAGIFKIKPLERIPRLVVKDFRNDTLMNMEAFKGANFPFSMLDEDIIAPCKTLPSSDESVSDSPVFLLQANFITGGLLLTFVGQHNTMDMTGQGQIIDLLSKACCNQQFTNEELSSGNLARRSLVPLLEDYNYRKGSELDHQIVKPTPPYPSPASSSPPKCTWTYFTFPPDSLVALKSLATEMMTSTYVSTDDTLSAFIWQSITRARLPRLDLTSESKSTFARAVDVRRYLNISHTYTGFMQNMTYNTYSLHKVVEEPLGRVASQLRLAVDPKISNLRYNTRALATLLKHTPDEITLTANLDLSVDLMLSSWAKLDCYELDFGLGLGKPEAVRRPQSEPVESLIYLMPKRLDGEIAVAICLRDEDMERLRADKKFVQYGTYIG